MPVVRSTTFVGRPSGSGFQPRSGRWVSFNATVDLGNMPTLGVRMEEAFGRHLTDTLAEAADLVIERAQSKLHPGHGYDTGLMSRSLTRHLVDGFMSAARVAYDLESDEAEYWVFVEFGHMMRNGQWWEGYHFLMDSVIEMEGVIRDKVREAWARTIVTLAGESAVSRAATAFTGPLPWNRHG